MTADQAATLVERIVGQFQMLRQYLNDEARRSYFEAFLPYDYEQTGKVIREVLLEEDQPPTAGWFVRKLRSLNRPESPPQIAEVRAPETPEERERRRNLMREALCDESGNPKNDFAAHVLNMWGREKAG